MHPYKTPSSASHSREQHHIHASEMAVYFLDLGMDVHLEDSLSSFGSSSSAERKCSVSY